MSIIQISKIQVRTGNLIDLPQLSAGEFGWADDDRRLFIGNDSNRVGDPDPNNTEILTTYSPIELSGNVTIANVENFHIGGGNNGYFLQTDGNGTLVWSALPGTSNITIAGSNNQIQYNVGGAFNASANFRYFDSNTTLQLGGGNGNIISSYLSVNISSIFANANFSGNIRMSNTDINTFAVGSLANTGNYVTIGSGQLFGNRITVNQANVNANIISNTITANLLIRAAATLAVNDGSGSNIAGNLIVGNNNVWANSDGISLTGNLTAQGNILGNNITVNSIVVSNTVVFNDVSISNGNIIAANITANTGVFTGNGSGLSSLNASNITSGTVSNARLSGNYTINASSATIANTVTTAAQPNITSVGTLTSLSVGDVTSTGEISANTLIISNGATITGTVTNTGSSNVSANLAVGGNITGTNANFSGNINAINFIGNVTTPTIVNGNSNIYIYPNTDIRMSSNNQLDIFVIQSNGITATTTIANSLTVAANISATNFHGALSNGTSNITVASNSNIVITVNGNNIANFTSTDANIFGNLVVGTSINVPIINAVLANGNSNISIPAVNGNVNISAIGTANVVVIANSGVIVNGLLTANGNVIATNVNAGNLLTANYLSGQLVTASQPNITAIGNLVNLNVSNSITVGANINANVLIAGNGLYGQLQTSNQSSITQIGQLGNLTVGNGLTISELYSNGDFLTTNAVVSGTLTVGGNVLITNLNLANGFTANGNITANYFLGNGSQLTGLVGPLFRAVNSVAESLTSGTTNLTYTVATDNIGAYYDTVTGRFTPLVAGYYQINVSMLPALVSGVQNGTFSVALYKNGTLVGLGNNIAITPTWGALGYSNLSILIYLDGVTDYISIGAVNSITSGTWETTASALNYFQAFWTRG